MRKKIWVGVGTGWKREVVRCVERPTFQTHGGSFSAMIGPFRTVRAANFMAGPGVNNPHVGTVADAERLAKAA